MKILIISDLHFKEANNWDDITSFTKEMTNRIKNKMLPDEDIAIITLGDIIDKGGCGNIAPKYLEAEQFYHRLQDDIPSASFYFTPGNHEIEADGTISSFNRFIKEINPKHPTFDVSVNRIELGGLSVFLVDSTLNRKHNLDGKVDTELLKNSLNKDTKNLICLHYPPYSSKGEDKGLENHKTLKATNSNFIFFGHQHGYPRKWDFLKKDSEIHAVSGMFADGANRGYILLDVLDGRIRYAYRYEYKHPLHNPVLLFPQKANLLSHDLILDEPHAHSTFEITTRSILPNNVTQDSYIYSLLNRTIHTTINVLKKAQFVAIYGEAGMGKSFEMVNVYHHYKNDPDYFPIFVKLGDHTDDYIKKCIDYTKNNTIDRKTPVLILDAYDEFTNRMFNLKQEISTLMSSNCEIKIIISSRTYSPIGIDGFTEYSLVPFSRSEITNIAQHHDVTDPDRFIKRIDDYDLLSMAEVPFYLFDIIEIYKENNDLPRRNVLVDEMIRHRFICADKKAHVSEDNSLMIQEAAIRKKLMELAFIMQVSQTDISNIKLTELFAPEIINLLKLTGMIDKVPQAFKWKFQHNIWREFLVAKYVSECSLDQILDIITYDKEHKHLRDSWKQAVGYLLSFRKKDDLKGWIIENAKDIVYHLEPGVLSREDKDKLFEFIVTDSYQKNLPIYTLFRDEKRFCAFYQSQSTIEFCLSTLRAPYDNCALNSIVVLLGNFTEFYGLEEELVTALINTLNAETPEYITQNIGDAILAISPNLSIEIADKLLDIVKSNNSPYLIDVFCYLINQWEYTERYADFIFGEIDNFKKYHMKFQRTPEIYKSMSYFTEVCNVIKAFDWHYKHLDNHYGFDIDYSFIPLLNTAEFLYKNGKHDILPHINEVFIYASRHGYHDKVKSILGFYDKCDIRTNVIKTLATRYSPANHDVTSAIFNLIDSNLVKVLSESFIQGDIDMRLMEMLFYKLRRNPDIAQIINNAVTKVTGNAFEEPEYIDWEEERIKNKQILFDSYFDKKLYRQNIELLLKYYPPETKCSELLDDSPSYEAIVENTLLRDTRLDLYWFSDYDDCTISTCTESSQWEMFCKHKIFDILSEEKTEVKITSLQTEYFENYFNENIEIFKSASTPIFATDNFLRAKHTIAMIKIFKYECCDEILLEMLHLPWHAFDSTAYGNQSLALDFVSEHVSDQQLLHNRIIENLRYKSLTDDGINTHIIYCHKKKLPYAVNIATKVFQDKEFRPANLIWDNAVDYLLAIKGMDYVDSLITDCNTDQQLDYLVRAKQPISQNSKLVSLLVKRNQKADNKTKFLINLICLNTEYGVKTYADLCRENKTIPGYLPGSDSLATYYQLTDAIKMIKDIRLINHLQNLIEIAYADDFRDADSYGLRNALCESVVNMGYNSPQKVTDMLRSLLALHPDNDGIKRICYRSINSIQSIINRNSDIPWDDDRISEFIIQQRLLSKSFNSI